MIARLIANFLNYLLLTFNPKRLPLRLSTLHHSHLSFCLRKQRKWCQRFFCRPPSASQQRTCRIGTIDFFGLMCKGLRIWVCRLPCPFCWLWCTVDSGARWTSKNRQAMANCAHLDAVYHLILPLLLVNNSQHFDGL
jgi:hypothetical protein